MNVSSANEDSWLSYLEVVPSWDPPLAPLVVIVPHPDDETLGCGGLITALRSHPVEVTVVAVTDGENAYPDDDCAAALRLTRIREQTAALDRLGVASDKVIRLGLPDGGVAQHTSDLIEFVLPLVSHETHLLVPWTRDFHPDHEACGRAGEELSRKTGAFLTYYFFWTWHRRDTASLGDMELRRFELTHALQETKAEALAEHISQLSHSSGRPILPDNLLAPARRPFEIFARQTMEVTSKHFFDEKYRGSEDPWEFATSEYELARYEATLGALSHRRYGDAFEPGCSIGVLTERLSQLCASLHAIDISDVAVGRARARCQHLPNVVIQQGSLPADIPPTKLDLIVFSEIGYYFTVPELTLVAGELVARMQLSGVFLAVHWLGHSEDHLLSGDEVHDILLATPGIQLEVSTRQQDYRLDRWVRV